MTRTMPTGIRAALASSATGFAAVIDGVLNVTTIGDTREAVAVYAFGVMGFRIYSDCACLDRDLCGCVEKALGWRFPNIKIIPVQVKECEHD